MSAPEDANSIVIDQMVDRQCDRFEQAWRSGEAKSIESWLDTDGKVAYQDIATDSLDNAQLFYKRLVVELIGLEISLRREQGETPQVHEYLQRFPDVDQSVLQRWVNPSPGNSVPEMPVTRSLNSDQAIVPDHIGAYSIIEKLGQGGMGEVYRAQQRSPIRREVAIKLIKLGMDTKSVIARFEAERQALALMDHPHIAKVYEASTDASGRPYFVMEYVRGLPITDYANQRKLNIVERLQLFQQVCRAIQHAHQKGVIHRDVKPSNVLTFTQDGIAHAKVIDFGVAKAVSQPLTDKTIYTFHSQFIGTPQYMSPEQAEGSLDIDTRTDVYSLGVLLYELLTGTTPFSLAELKSAALEHIRRIICEVEPARPSTRLSGTEPSLVTLAAQRSTEPQKLGSLVRGELDWIVMMSLEKDRRRRYSSPGEMAEDIANYLEGRPVAAVPPSRFYRWQKAIRKHRWPVGIAIAFILLLVIGSTISLIQTARAVSALKEVEVQKTRAESNQQQAEMALKDSQKNLYFASVALAHRDSLANSADSAMSILEGCPPELRGWEWGYIQRLCHAHLRLWNLEELKLQFATSLAVNPTGTLLAVGSHTGVAVVRVDDGQLLHHWGTTEPVRELAFSLDGQTLTIGTGNWLDNEAADPGRLLTYELATGLLKSEKEAGFVSALDVGPKDSLIFATQREIISQRGTVQKVLASAPDANGWAIESLRFNRSHTRFAEVQRFSVARIRSASNGKLQYDLVGHSGIVWDCAFSPDGRLLATASDDELVKIWDATNGRELLTLRGHQRSVNAVAFSPDGALVASGGVDQHIYLWEPNTGELVRVLRGHTSAIQALAFCPDGRLVSCDESDKLIMWDPDSDQEALVLKEPGAMSATFVGDGQLLSIGTNQQLTTWQATTGALLHQAKFNAWGLFKLACNAKGQCIALGETVEVFDRIAGEKLFEIPTTSKLYKGKVMIAHAVVFHPDGDTFAIAFHDGVRIFSLAQRAELRTLSGSGIVAFSPDGKLLIAGAAKKLVVWDTTSWQPIKELSVNVSGTRYAAFHPNSRWLASGGQDKLVRIWDIATGERLVELKGHTAAVNSLAFSPNGRRLATAGADMVIRLWDTDSWRQVITLSGHSDRIDSLEFSPDGTSLCSASFDGTVRIWESGPKTAEIEKMRHELRRVRNAKQGEDTPAAFDWLLKPIRENVQP